jgi:hypothetical protein
MNESISTLVECEVLPPEEGSDAGAISSGGFAEESLPEDAHYDLAIRLLVAALSASRYANSIRTPFLPYVRELEFLERRAGVQSFLKWAFRASLPIAFLPGGAKLGGLVGGSSVLAHLFLNRPSYSTASQAYAYLMLQCALRGRGMGSFPARVHLALVYGGAGLNKLLSRDWRSGRAFGYFSGVLVENPVYRWFERQVPPAWLAFAGAWATILFEMTIGLLYLWRPTAGLAALMGIIFHISCMCLTKGTIAWIYIKFSLCPAALLLGGRPKPRSTPGSLAGAVLRYGFWFGALGLTLAAESVFVPAYRAMRHHMPTLEPRPVSPGCDAESLIAGRN